MIAATYRPKTFPRWPFAGAVALLAFAFMAIVFGQQTGIGTMLQSDGQPVDMRDIILTERADGVLEVLDHQTRAIIAEFPPGEGGFVRGSLRGLMRDRKTRSIAQDTPFRLILWESRRLTLSDTGGGMKVDLLAFGPTNAGAYARFLDRGSDQK